MALVVPAVVVVCEGAKMAVEAVVSDCGNCGSWNSYINGYCEECEQLKLLLSQAIS